MKAENVNPKNFKVNCIIYETDKFSIVHGESEDGFESLAMRWNGEEEEIGYPNAFGNPMWFVIPENLGRVFTKSLIDLPNCNLNEIINVLKK